MNWFYYKTRKPQAEPKRKILLDHMTEFGRHRYSLSDSDKDFRVDPPTHWAEIEGPRLEKIFGSKLKTPPPPKPDPFEEAWNSYDPTVGLYTAKAVFRSGWDAAMKHKEKS